MTVHILVAFILLFVSLGGLSVHYWQPTYWLSGSFFAGLAILCFFLIMVGVIHI